MSKLSRRNFSLLVGGVLCCSCGRVAAQSDPSVCDPSFEATNGAAGSVINYGSVTPLFEDTSDDFDDDYKNSFVWVLADIANYLGLNFGFGLYTETTIPNAAFVPADLIKPMKPDLPSDGTILVGRNLLKETRRVTKNLGAALTALCAHESGHALQRKHRLLYKFTTAGDSFFQVRYELCADFVCGYYGAHRVERQPNYPVLIQAITQLRKGDQIFEPSGHGAPKHRADAVQAGAAFGRLHPGDGKAAVNAGVEYALALKFQ
ncbi:hypothetical protein FXV83_00765 [Bradyrhizobium hipponense]|uniref:Metalloprotease n=1 Tax=Bradyrhizobium hipponense TaxID=2605638 RepID=A0A5S4YXR2_9BRAD|nr:hypothetical protein [Bradyrhizobium hipponense]TYO68396.1 hypothetical protein FXV83_00765 [Bradyrhizobium hipponense]